MLKVYADVSKRNRNYKISDWEQTPRGWKTIRNYFSPNKRLLVEAPAGYGKTHTMVSRIAYLISIGKLPVPKNF